MNKKLLLCGVFSLALVAGISNAQPTLPEADAAPAKVRFMQHKGEHKGFENRLNLTDEQKEQADKIREQGRKEIEPYMEEMKTLRGKMDEIRKKNMEEFEQILTAEQKAEMEKIKSEMKEKMEHHRGHRMLPPPPHGENGEMLPPPHGDEMLPPPLHRDEPQPAQK